MEAKWVVVERNTNIFAVLVFNLLEGRTYALAEGTLEFEVLADAGADAT